MWNVRGKFLTFGPFHHLPHQANHEHDNCVGLYVCLYVCPHVSLLLLVRNYVGFKEVQSSFGEYETPTARSNSVFTSKLKYELKYCRRKQSTHHSLTRITSKSSLIVLSTKYRMSVPVLLHTVQGTTEPASANHMGWVHSNLTSSSPRRMVQK